MTSPEQHRYGCLTFPTFHPNPFPPSYLGDLKPFCLEEAKAASPAAYSKELPLGVKGHTIQGTGAGVLGSQLSPHSVP